MIRILIVLLTCGAEFSQGYDIGANRLGGCDVSINIDLEEPQPLLLVPNTKEFYWPVDNKGTLRFTTSQSILLACPGAGNYVSIKSPGIQEVAATCIDGQVFAVDGVKTSFDKLTCKIYPEHVARRNGRACYDNHTEIEVGFEVSTGFLQLYTVCHDEYLASTLYAQATVQSSIAGFQQGFERADWTQGNFHQGLDPTYLFKRATERVTLTKLLSSKTLAEKYIHLTNDYFLSKGHLVAKADFVYGSQQRSTFYYINAAPQWQTLNGGNWNSLENDVRNLASSLRTNLVVYTGTEGIATLPDENDNQVKLYLSDDSNNNVAMPVPGKYWKVLYEPISKKGIAFVSLNNPYQSLSSAKDGVLCKDICDQVSWRLTWYQNDIVKGYSYCCEVGEFRKAFKSLPSFEVTGILK